MFSYRTIIGLHRPFFVAAALQAILALAIWIFWRPEGADPATWHGHEMVFGYAIAVIAGFLFTKVSGRTAIDVLLVWSAARIAWLLDTSTMLPALLSAAATCIIAAIAARGFLQGVKRWQNAPFPLVLAAIAGGDVLSLAGTLVHDGALARSGVFLGLFAVVILIVMMGGRIAGAALSGLVQRAGGARIAPELALEKFILITLAASGILIAFNAPTALVTVCSWLAGGAMLWRMRRWRGALRLAGADLRAIAAGQVFIAAGLLGIGAGVFHPPWPSAAPLHLITIGGIGMTTATMMLKTTAQRGRRPLPGSAIAAAALCLGLAALLRAGGFAFAESAYAASALLWMAALAVCAISLLRRN